MRYRRLGRTELRVSVVGVGTWQLGGEWGRQYDAKEVAEILGRARELGLNLIDTAECYGDHTSEELIGRAIAGSRDHWVLATKFGHRYTTDHEREQEWSVGQVLAQLERSLRALRTDHIDLYQFHSGSDEQLDNDELWAALHERVQAGVIGHLGVSIGATTNVHQARRAVEVGASVLQVVYSRLDTEPEGGILPVAERDDLGVLAREPLAGGLLGGRYRPGTRFTDPTDTRSRRPPEQIDRRLEEAMVVQQREVPAGQPMAAWALAWCLANPAVTAVIPGCKSPAQVEANAAASDLVAPR